MSLVTKRLVAQGYAETEEDPNDRRASVVRLTNAGRTWAHDMVRRITRAEDGAMAALAPEEQEALVSLRKEAEALREKVRLRKERERVAAEMQKLEARREEMKTLNGELDRLVLQLPLARGPVIVDHHHSLRARPLLL